MSTLRPSYASVREGDMEWKKVDSFDNSGGIKFINFVSGRIRS